MYSSKKHYVAILCLLVWFAFSLSFSSCIPTRKVVYFNDIKDTMSAPVVISNFTKFEDPTIQPNDILTITVQTIEQNESNTPITSNSIATFNPLNGFLVDKNGEVELSLVGFVKVAGLTTAEARELIKQKARDFYKEPVVNVRIANFNISVLGDVTKPGVVNFPDERASIFDAITQANDINLTARKDNVLLVRSENGQKKIIRLDLNSSEILKSPYFYLKNRDILYVQPRKSKIRDSDNRFVKYISIATTIVSLTTLLLAYKSVKF
jgi:polysaccharide biosynthesis/export protein